jgi:hypothetical protein
VNASDTDIGVPTDVAVKTRRFGLFSVRVFAIFAVLNVGALIALPHDKYLRYQVPNDLQAPNSYWIYERIHFDPTPIDVAFIGSSRTGQSIHSGRLQEDFAHQGIDIHAVNFFCVRAGVNIQYVIAKELLNSRKVKLLVLEMTEREERKPHDAFVSYADPIDILNAPLLVNVNYLSDIARLPGRQVHLAYQTALQSWGLRHPNYVPPPYEGPNLDYAEFITSMDRVRHSRSVSHSKDEMDLMRTEWLHQLTQRVVPQSLSDIEFRFPRYYERELLELARAHETQVVFLYTPQYGGPANPSPYAMYSSRAGLINPWPVLQDYRLWFDENHLNWQGAQHMTDFVADALVKHPGLGSGASRIGSKETEPPDRSASSRETPGLLPRPPT